MIFKKNVSWPAQFTVLAVGVVATLGLIFGVPRLVDFAFDPLFWVATFVFAIYIQRLVSRTPRDASQKKGK